MLFLRAEGSLRLVTVSQAEPRLGGALVYSTAWLLYRQPDSRHRHG